MEPNVKPWHGISREAIVWNPKVDEKKCIGCGMCVTGCGRKVYGFDYERKKPVVLRPANCMVACVTCANTCLQDAISFPPSVLCGSLSVRRSFLRGRRRN